MAIAVQTVSTATFATNATFTGSRPTGTQDGDLLVAIIANEGGQTVSSVPSGWVLVEETSELNGDFVRIYWKEASSEPASWNWTFSATTEHFGGVLRIDGQVATNPVDVDAEASVDKDETPSYSSGITPTYENSLLIMAIIANSQTTSGASGYAIATDNPTWTEQIELYEVTIGMGLYVATAVRPENTATGNASATLAGTSAVDSACILASFIAINNVTINPSVIDITIPPQAPTVAADGNVTVSVIDIASSVQAPTVSVGTNKWSNTSKTDTNPVITNTLKT